MEYNIDGDVDRYFDLDKIFKLDIDNKDIIKENFHKLVYFDYKGSCKVGKLIGIEMNYKLSMIYYIIEDLENNKIYIPINKSITKL